MNGVGFAEVAMFWEVQHWTVATGCVVALRSGMLTREELVSLLDLCARRLSLRMSNDILLIN